MYQGVLSEAAVMLSPPKPEIGIETKLADADAVGERAIVGDDRVEPDLIDSPPDPFY